MAGYNFTKYCIFCGKIFFTLTNSADPDKMPHNAAFHQFASVINSYRKQISQLKDFKKYFLFE